MYPRRGQVHPDACYLGKMYTLVPLVAPFFLGGENGLNKLFFSKTRYTTIFFDQAHTRALLGTPAPRLGAISSQVRFTSERGLGRCLPAATCPLLPARCYLPAAACPLLPARCYLPVAARAACGVRC